MMVTSDLNDDLLDLFAKTVNIILRKIWITIDIIVDVCQE